jgi:hypothetical protein
VVAKENVLEYMIRDYMVQVSVQAAKSPSKMHEHLYIFKANFFEAGASGKKTATRIFKRNSLPAPVNIAGLCRNQLYLLQIIVQQIKDHLHENWFMQNKISREKTEHE